ncbi:MAG TPA: TrbC/VirB2 family protein [Variovorax sp.]|jgi:type IV secretory pathway VirB2 component (pilin)|nr:TrbC/VirB2 family protein [Variovorax sp.]
MTFLPSNLSFVHPDPLSRSSRLTTVLVMFSAFALLMLLASHAHAASGAGGGLPYEDWLTRIRQSITGPVAFGISVIAIVAAGAMLIFGGDMNGFMKTLVFIVLVLAFVIAAQNTLSAITGTGAVIASLPTPLPLTFSVVRA